MLKITAAIMAVTVAILSTTPAFADHRRHDRGSYTEYRYEYRYKKEYRARRGHHRHVRRDRDAGDALAAGILGLAVGAIAAGILNQQHRQAPRYEYREYKYSQPTVCGGYNHPNPRKRCPRGHVLEGQR